MSLKLIKRGRYYYVRGTVRGTPCFETTGTSDRKQAEAYRAKRETGLYEKSIFGERAVVSFNSAALAYLDFQPRSQRTKDYVGALQEHFGSTLAASIDQAAADRAVTAIVGTGAAPSTKVRVVYTPLAAVLAHSGIYPKFKKPQQPKGKTRWLTPQEAGALIAGAAPHLRPLLIFFLGTGARVSEALDLQWSDVDLGERRAMLRDTKNGLDRKALLPPAVVEALANLPRREGAVFRRDDGDPYADRERLEGGQIKTAFHTACRRAQIRDLTPHDLRHTWASWFYAVSKDLLLLKAEGGWRTLSMVERYSHLMPSELVPQIARVWGGDHPGSGAKSVQPTIIPAKIA
jgi:integrase